MLNRKQKLLFFVFAPLAALFLFWLLFYSFKGPVLEPKGIIALKERNLIFVANLLMLIVVIPTFIFSVVIAWKYRESNLKAKYSPEWDKSALAETIWWGIPCIIIFILSVITWKSSLELDPFKPLASNKKPLVIQVVALQWRWLFIYPEENIATINLVQFPENTPIKFEITADAPMNSFWIPQLSGQIFAMPGMKTQLHLVADTVGNYRGVSANISGKGFAGMKFNAKVCTQKEYESWIASAKQSGNSLSLEEYKKIAKPSEDTNVVIYSLKAKDLYDWIVMKFMMPMKDM